jgi:hypothetical protein
LGDGDNNDGLFMDRTVTRVLSRPFQIDGVTFAWWSATGKPTFVTVSSDFGSKAALTDGDPEEFARELARRLLRERADRGKIARK